MSATTSAYARSAQPTATTAPPGSRRIVRGAPGRRGGLRNAGTDEPGRPRAAAPSRRASRRRTERSGHLPPVRFNPHGLRQLRPAWRPHRIALRGAPARVAPPPARRPRDLCGWRSRRSARSSPSRSTCSPTPRSSATSAPARSAGSRRRHRAHRGVRHLQLPRLLHDRRRSPAASAPATSGPRPSTASTASGSRSGSASRSRSSGCSLAPVDRRRDGRVGARPPVRARRTCASACSARPFVLVALAGTGYLRGMQDTRTTARRSRSPRTSSTSRSRCSRLRLRPRASPARRGARSIAQIGAARRVPRRSSRRIGARGRTRRSGPTRAGVRADGRRRQPAHRPHRRRCSPRSSRRPRSRRGSATSRSPRTRSRSRSGYFLALCARRDRDRRPGDRRPVPRRRATPPAPARRPAACSSGASSSGVVLGVRARAAPARCSCRSSPTTRPSQRPRRAGPAGRRRCCSRSPRVVFVLDGILIGAGDSALPRRSRWSSRPRLRSSRPRCGRRSRDGGLARAVGRALRVHARPASSAWAAGTAATAGSSPAQCAALTGVRTVI